MAEAEWHESRLAAPVGCQAFDAGLADYLEGEDKPEVAAHADECIFCGALLGDLKRQMTASAALGDQDPPARLWANIRVALISEGLLKQEFGLWQRWFSGLAFLRNPAPVAALAGLVLLSALLVTPSRMLNSEANRAPQQSGGNILASRGVPVDTNLEATVQELQKIYDARAVAFEPAMSATYQKGLKSLDVSIEQCRDSVRREPTNRLAREYLLAAYEQKAEVLQSALEFDGR